MTISFSEWEMHETKTRIFIVEDEPLIAADLEWRLLELGYQVLAVASSGREAIENIRNTSPDLVLMDINIAGELDGIETAQAVRASLAVPVVFLTACRDRETILRATNTDPFGYLVKPINDDNLVSAIETAIYKHEMEQRLRQREAWLSTTLRCAADAILVTDRVGRIEFLNDQCRKLLSLEKESVKAKLLSEIIPLRYRNGKGPVGDLVSLAILHGATMDLGSDLVLPLPSGDIRQIEGEVALSEADGEVMGTVFTFRDVTLRNAQEEQNRHAAKNSAVTRFSKYCKHRTDRVVRGGAERYGRSLGLLIR